MRFATWAGAALALGLGSMAMAAESREAIRFDTGFEGGALGRIEQTGEGSYRLRIPGQQDNRGHNWQGTWFYFRMDAVRGRALTLTLTDFLGEYNDQPGIAHVGSPTKPVFSYDNEHWEHLADVKWDDGPKEMTFRLTPTQDRVWFALVPPYPHSRLLGLLADVRRSPHARVEVMGQTVFGRDLHRVVVGPLDAGAARKVVWLQARQHAWEAGTSFVLEGALRFVLSDDSRAKALRERVTFVFTPMLDPDGCALGRVRFNAHGYDLNRHFDQVDLNDPQWRERVPETWQVKRTIAAHLGAGRRIDLFLNLHNTEMPEYVNTVTDGQTELPAARKLFDLLVANTTFDPNRPFTLVPPSDPNVPHFFAQRGIPYCMMEQRIAAGQKLGHLPTTDDRLAFGAQLIQAMAEAVR